MVKAYLDKLLEIGTVLCTAGIVVSVTIQVFARIFLPSAPPWTEEAARLCFVFAIAFAAGLAVRDRAFVRVEVLLHWIPARFVWILELLIHGIVALMMLVVCVYSIGFMKLGLGQQSPSLEFPMVGAHGAMLLLAVMLTLYSILAAVRVLRDRAKESSS